jgi:hypothetical protein
MAFRTPRGQPSTPHDALRSPVQNIQLQDTAFVSAVTYLLSSLGCLPLTNQNP